MPENAKELRRTKVNIREHKRINLKLFREDQPGLSGQQALLIFEC